MAKQGNYGHKQSKTTKSKIAKGMTGPKNPAFKDGRRSYRENAGLKPGDSRIAHHQNKNRHDNRKSNVKVVSRKKHEGPIHHRGKNFSKNKKK